MLTVNITPQRILAIRNGTEMPLFDTAVRGQSSPSDSLLIETHECAPGDWQSRLIPSQLISMMLRPTAIMHAVGDGPISKIEIPARSIVFSLRQREESLRWLRNAEIISVKLNDAVLAQACEELVPGGRFELLANPKVQNEQLAALMYALYLEQANGYASGRLFVEGIEQAICTLLVARYNAFSRPVVLRRHGLPPWAIKRVEEYIYANVGQSIQIKDLADCVDFSVAHFSRLFHASFGESPHQFVLRVRIERAKTLLHQHKHSILHVALACGFQNSQHFSRTFHRFVGIPPSRFCADA